MSNHKPFLNPVNEGVAFLELSDADITSIEMNVGNEFRLTVEQRRKIQHIIWSARSEAQRVENSISLSEVRKLLEKVQNCAPKLADALSRLTSDRDVNSPEFRARQYLEAAIPGLMVDKLTEAITAIAQTELDTTGAAGAPRQNILTDIVVVGLAHVYEEASGRRAGISTSSPSSNHPGELGGPFVRFVANVCGAANIGYTQNTQSWASQIRRALETRPKKT